jgi:tRNA/tmRNA/rRNA uracil-C5-methylase (TrmA/RlmC/RlmD family)
MKTYRPRAGRARIDPEPRVAVIDAFDDDGRGIARIDGKVTFIDGALPGEAVRARVFRSKKAFDQGQVIEVLSPSPERVEPPCPHFGLCGGCSLQHLDPRAQVRAKQAVLAGMLRKAGGVAPGRWLDPLEGPVRHYRRSARLGVRDVPKKGGIIVGFRERRSSYINPTHDCLVLDARVARLLPLLPSLIEGITLQAAPAADRGGLQRRRCGLVLPPSRSAERGGSRTPVRIRSRARGSRSGLQPGGPETHRAAVAGIARRCCVTACRISM